MSEEKIHIEKAIVPFKEYANMKAKIKNQKEEIQRLNNIINEIEKYVEKNKENISQTLRFDENKSYNSALLELLDKIKELKEKD